MIDTRFEKLPSLFARIKGRSGVVREYNCLLSPLSEYCIVPKVDAYSLGYSEVAFQNIIVSPPNSRTLLTNGGHHRTVVFTIDTVEIGQLLFNSVEFAAFDLPQASGYDAVIGKSLLEQASVTLDWRTRTIKLGKSL